MLLGKMKERIGKIGWILGLIFLLWLCLEPWIGWFRGGPSPWHVHEGEPCGPGERWTYITGYPDAELSCEPEQ